MLIDIVGIVRFNVVTETAGFRKLHGRNLSEIAAETLHPDRITRRLSLFRNIPLKAFQNQTDKNFRALVLISTLLEDRFKAELTSLAHDNPFLVIDEVDPKDTVRDAIFRHIPDRCVTFRLDDDDAVHPTHVAELRKAAGEIEPNTVISFPNGFYLGANQRSILFQDKRWILNAFGISYFSDERQSIFHLGSHTKLDRCPMVLRETPQAWMRSIHGGTASGAKMSAKRPMILMPPAFMTDYAPDYGFIDFKAVRDLLN